MLEGGFPHTAGRKRKCLNSLPTLRPSMTATAAYLAEGDVPIRLGLGVQLSLSFSFIAMHQQDWLIPEEARRIWNTSFTELDSCLVREHQLLYHPHMLLASVETESRANRARQFIFTDQLPWQWGQGVRSRSSTLTQRGCDSSKPLSNELSFLVPKGTWLPLC